LPSPRAFSSCFSSTAGDQLDVVLVDLGLLVEQAVEDSVMCFVSAPFFEPLAFASCLFRGASACRIWIATLPTVSSSFAVSLRSSRMAAFRTDSRSFFESSVVILGRHLDEQAADELACLLERREACSSAQLERRRVPEVVVLVEVPLLALGEVLPAALEPVLERDKLARRGPTMICSTRPLTLSSRPFRSFWRASTSTEGDDRRREEEPSPARAVRCRAGSRSGSGHP